LVDEWVEAIGLRSEDCGTHSLAHANSVDWDWILMRVASMLQNAGTGWPL
jgi:hypothetical protein